MIRILIVDDHALVRQGLRAILEREATFEIVAECGDGQDAIRHAGRTRPDVVLMDLSLPGGIGGLDATEAILAQRPETRVIVLTQYDNDEYVRRALRAGAAGYLPKTGVADQLCEAIRAVNRGQRYLHPSVAGVVVDLLRAGRGLDDDDAYRQLTRRERQVFSLLAEGKTSREIARYLEISLKTAMTHRAHVMQKLGLHSRAALIRYAIRKRLVPLDPG